MTTQNQQNSKLNELTDRIIGSLEGKRVSINSVSGAFSDFGMKLLNSGCKLTVADSSKSAVLEFYERARGFEENAQQALYRTVPLDYIQAEPADIFIALVKQEKLKGRNAGYKQRIELGEEEAEPAEAIKPKPAQPAAQAAAATVQPRPPAQPVVAAAKQQPAKP